MAEDLNHQEEVQVDTPVGKFRARGTDIIAVITMVAVCMMVYALYTHQEESKVGMAKAVEAVEKLRESQMELNYLMTLTPEQRARLDLEMPESLRRKLR